MFIYELQNILVKEEVESLKHHNMDLTNKLDDSINRSMRGNLVYLNIPEEEGENPVRTKKILSEELANNFTQKSPEIILQRIVRAHTEALQDLEINLRDLSLQNSQEKTLQKILIKTFHE